MRGHSRSMAVASLGALTSLGALPSLISSHLIKFFLIPVPPRHLKATLLVNPPRGRVAGGDVQVYRRHA